MNHLTAVELLASAVKAELDQAPETFDHPRTCVITGQKITEGYHARDIIPSSTSEFLDLLHGDPDGVMSVPAARVYKSAWNMGSRLAFADGTCYHPLIDRKSAAAQGRVEPAGFDHVFIADGKLTHPIPVAAAPALGLFPEAGPMMLGWTPPAWKRNLLAPCYPAGAPVRQMMEAEDFYVSA